MSSESIPAGIQQLIKKIDTREAVLTTTMQEVRDAYGSGRLGVNVREGISELLLQQGIGHIPRKLPAYQDQPVRLYRLGSPVGKLIQAALKVSDRNDEVLRRAAAGDASKVLQKVRELVCT